MVCDECKPNRPKGDWFGNFCPHCDICGADGVGKDPRFQRGGWCEVCKAKCELAEAEWYKNNDSSNMEDGAMPWWDDFKRMVN